jgi:hypothetical protein
MLDNMQMYHRALTEKEVERLYKLYLRKASQKKDLLFLFSIFTKNFGEVLLND